MGSIGIVSPAHKKKDKTRNVISSSTPTPDVTTIIIIIDFGSSSNAMDDDTITTTKTGTNGSSEKTDDDDAKNKNDEKKDIEMTTTTRVGQLVVPPSLGEDKEMPNNVAETAAARAACKNDGTIRKNASDSDLTATNFEMHNASSNGSAQQDPGSSDPNGKPSKPPSKPSLLNPKNANNNNNNNANNNSAGESAKLASITTTPKKEDITSPSRRESGRIKSLHVQRATLDAEAKARALKFTCSLFPRANIRVKYLGMVDEEIAEKMDVEKMAKEHYKEGGNVQTCSSSKSSANVEKNEVLKPLGYRCEGTLFSEPFEATIDENGYHFVRWGAEGEGRRVVETPCSTSISIEKKKTTTSEEQNEMANNNDNDSSDTTPTNNNNNNNKGLLDVDASVKCIVEEIARRFDNKIPGMKPSSSSLLKLNTGNSNNNNGNGSGSRLCSNCGAGSNSTPLMRRGPDGVRSLCNACGLWYARRGTQRPVEGGSVAEREAKAAKESMSATGGQDRGGDGELNIQTKEEEEEAKRQREKEIEEKEKLARMVPKIESLSGYAVFGYHEHIVQEALRAHLIAKYAPSLGIDVLMAAGMKKYGRYESSLSLLKDGKNQPAEQRRSSKRERKEITKFVDVAYTNAPPRRKTNASSKAASKKLKAQQASEGKVAKKAAAAAGGAHVAKKVGMRKNASDRSMTDRFFGGLNEPPITSNKNKNVQQHRQPTVSDDLQSWENDLFNNSFGGEQMYTNIILGNQERQQQHSNQQQLMRDGSGELRGFSPPNNISNANIINNVPNPGNFQIEDDLLGLDALIDNHESLMDGNMF